MYFDEINSNFNKYEEEKNYLNLLNNNEYNNNDYTIKFDNININNYRKESNDLYSLSEGFNKGNMFEKIYKPYKKHNYKVIVENKKDFLLLQIQELVFALKDLNLYLDINPMDEKYVKIFNNFNSLFKQKKDEYERNYGPLSSCSTIYSNSFSWINDPWPWENKGDEK